MEKKRSIVLKQKSHPITRIITSVSTCVVVRLILRSATTSAVYKCCVSYFGFCDLDLLVYIKCCVSYFGVYINVVSRILDFVI